VSGGVGVAVVDGMLLPDGKGREGRKGKAACCTGRGDDVVAVFGSAISCFTLDDDSVAASIGAAYAMVPVSR
jgi:hypothetical protein